MGLVETLKKHEGFSGKLYRCPEGKLTIGYGFNLEAIEMPEHVAEYWLEYIALELHTKLRKEFSWFLWESDGVQNVLIDMAYNLGLEGLKGFKKMLAAIEAQDYRTAAIEMLDSKWAEQVGQRAIDLSKIMEEG